MSTHGSSPRGRGPGYQGPRRTRRGWAQQRLYDALVMAGPAGLTRRDLALAIYCEDTATTRHQVTKLIGRASRSKYPVDLEARRVYRLRQDYCPRQREARSEE